MQNTRPCKLDLTWTVHLTHAIIRRMSVQIKYRSLQHECWRRWRVLKSRGILVSVCSLARCFMLYMMTVWCDGYMNPLRQWGNGGNWQVNYNLPTAMFETKSHATLSVFMKLELGKSETIWADAGCLIHMVLTFISPRIPSFIYLDHCTIPIKKCFGLKYSRGRRVKRNTNLVH